MSAPVNNAAIIPAASTPRMSVSFVTSMAVHGAILGLFMYTSHLAAKHRVTIVHDVDFIQVKKAMALPKPVAKAEPRSTTFDFLKMALPAVPKAAMPKSMSVKLPDVHRPMQAQAPKIEMDRKKLDAGPKLDMDLDKGKALDIAKVEARIPAKKMAALAAMPRLEDVGRRRVANLPAAIQMEENRQQAAMGLQGAGALAKMTGDRHAAVAAGEPLQDAGPAAPTRGSAFGQKIASMLPSDAIEMKHAVMPTQAPKSAIAAPEVAPKRKSSSLQATESKKGVEIEGPLADRKVMAYEIPEFPQWAKDQGVLEASVSIRFWVDKQGEVLPNMRVEHTSGYGRLDRLAMDALSRWKFAPLLEEAKQWGVITFRFVLE